MRVDQPERFERDLLVRRTGGRLRLHGLPRFGRGQRLMIVLQRDGHARLGAQVRRGTESFRRRREGAVGGRGLRPLCNSS